LPIFVTLLARNQHSYRGEKLKKSILFLTLLAFPGRADSARPGNAGGQRVENTFQQSQIDQGKGQTQDQGKVQDQVEVEVQAENQGQIAEVGQERLQVEQTRQTLCAKAANTPLRDAEGGRYDNSCRATIWI
jgi:hypothetical protein